MQYFHRHGIIWFLVFFLMFNISYSLGEQVVSDCGLDDIVTEIKKITKYPELYQSFWGIAIQSVSTGKIIYEENAHKLLMPASVLKIITACVALHKLGEDFRYYTRIYTSGKVNNGTLDGNVIITSNGNPTISFRYHGNNGKQLFYKWADKLVKAGISKVNGKIVLIDEAFDDRYYGEGWILEDMSYWYSSEISGVQFNESTITFNATGSKKSGTPIIFSYKPRTTYVQFVNNAITSSSDTYGENLLLITREPSGNVIHINGSLAPSETFVERLAIHNPPAFFGTVLKESLEEKNIIVSGKPAVRSKTSTKNKKKTWKLIDTAYSPPLKSIVNHMLKYSNNLFAETIIKTLGHRVYKHGSCENGLRVVKNRLKKWGISQTEYNIRDGSGVCRYNYVTPMVLLKVLKAAYKESWFDTFYNALPVAGHDGTLKKRMKNTSASGNLRAKTGYIYGAYSLCGYVKGKDNQLYNFVLIINNFNLPKSTISFYHDLICERLSNLSLQE